MSARTLREWISGQLEFEKKRRQHAAAQCADGTWRDANATIRTLETVIRELDAPDDQEPPVTTYRARPA